MSLPLLLSALRCPDCHALDTLWLDLDHALVECRECGACTRTFSDPGDGRCG